MEDFKRIKVLPVAFESLGVRSMCTYVETPDVGVLLDAGVSLGPNRYGFSPHPKEYMALKQRRGLMLEIAEKAQLITISHYHFDHHTPSYTDWVVNWSSSQIAEKIYKGKIVLAKGYRSQINFSQRHRGWMFTKTGGKQAARLEDADGKSFQFGDTSVSFSMPVFHGPEGSELGWVLMTVIKCYEENILFAPDVQGPVSKKTLRTMLATKPRLAIIGGPPLYLLDFKANPENMKMATENLLTIAEQVPVTILDHHLLREEKWKESVQRILDLAENVGHKILTAAEFSGTSNVLLESQRKTLFETEPPSREFVKWMKIPIQNRKLVLPPI